MENLIAEAGSLVKSLILPAGFIYLIYSSWQRKQSVLDNLSKSLNARSIDAGVIGRYGTFEYMLYVDEGHTGGAASGPTNAGFPSSLRIIVEKKGAVKFFMTSAGKSDLQNVTPSSEKIESAAKALFDSGFKKIDFDGETLDIKLYPYMIDGPVDANFIQNILPSVEVIVESIDSRV